MPFLTIITRSFRRPNSLARCVQSVARQTDPDAEQIILYDTIGHGVGQSYLNLRHLTPQGEYVFLLDDDDYLIDTGFVAALRQCALANAMPDVIYALMDHCGTMLPDWDDGLKRGNIACSCYVVRRDVWLEHASDFIDDYSADFYFIEAIHKCPRQHSAAHLDRIASRSERMSNGQPENIFAVA
jgi:glycosyltransferase involved in cell wall biosynthesis